jgi:hypothetical protein
MFCALGSPHSAFMLHQISKLYITNTPIRALLLIVD